jgi:outer membrane protein assembly factor BamB
MRIPFNGSPLIGPDGTILAVAGVITERYSGGSGLYALRPDGQKQWLYKDHSLWSNPLLGIDGTVIVHAPFLRVFALDIATGDFRYHVLVSTEAHPPVMDSRGVFYYFPADDVSCFTAVTADGTLVWLIWELGRCQPEPHVVGPDNTVYVCTDDSWLPANQVYLHALGEGGQAMWRHPLHTFARLAVSAANLVLAWQYNGTVQALSASGELVWEHQLSPFDVAFPTPTFGPNNEACLSMPDGQIVVVAADGGIRWRQYLPSLVLGGPRIGPDGTIYVGCADGQVYALWPDGSIRWRFRTEGEIHSRPAISDGVLYVGSNDGYLYALDMSGTEIWRFAATIEDQGHSTGRA